VTTLDLPVQRGIPDLCADLFAFALHLRQAKDPGTAQNLRNRIHAMFEALDRQAHAAGVDAQHVQAARYALVAFLDEIVLHSHWDIRSDWASRPLQLEYFNEFAAGQGFFTRLEELRRNRSPVNTELLEVYALVLGLGFKGRYADLAGMEQLKVLLGQLTKEIQDARDGSGPELSPQWKRDEPLQEAVKNIPVWVVASIGFGFVLLLFLILDLVLGFKVDNFREDAKDFLDAGSVSRGE